MDAQRIADRLAALILDLNAAREDLLVCGPGDRRLSAVAAQVVAVHENLKPVRNGLRELAADALLADLEEVEMDSPVPTAPVATAHG